MAFLIVTGANEAFAPLLRRLIASLQQWEPLQGGALACLDVGLGANTREWLSQYTQRIVEPSWDLPVSEQLKGEQAHLRALTARPFLPRYFPGFEYYLWLDADTWVQQNWEIGDRP